MDNISRCDSMSPLAEIPESNPTASSELGGNYSSKVTSQPSPIVSIIIPCRNEVQFIGRCLDSLVQNGFPTEQMEILVIDGMSDDGTRKLVDTYCKTYPVRLLDNPQRTTPYALNIGIRNAAGDIVMRVDAHSVCEKQYITGCLNALRKYEADDVGGRWRIVPRDNTLVGRAIARAISNRFGVGNVRYRLTNTGTPTAVDTVPFFCCRKELFGRIGLFNERLTRIQDQEFNERIGRAGGKILLVPDVLSYYLVRSDLSSFWRHNWADGVWSMLAFAYSEIMPVRGRHLVPLAFVAVLILSLFVSPLTIWPLALLGGTYAVVNLIASIEVCVVDRDIKLLPIMPAVFATLHFGRGFGSLWGVIRLAMERRLARALRLMVGQREMPVVVSKAKLAP